MISKERVTLILLAMPHSQANVYALEQIKARHFQGKIAAICERLNGPNNLLCSNASIPIQ